MKGKALRKHSLHGKIADSGIETVVMKYATPPTPPAHEQNSFFECKQHTIHGPNGPEKI